MEGPAFTERTGSTFLNVQLLLKDNIMTSSELMLLPKLYNLKDLFFALTYVDSRKFIYTI